MGRFGTASYGRPFLISESRRARVLVDQTEVAGVAGHGGAVRLAGAFDDVAHVASGGVR
jgi:hypothetical protein